ncbi:MAG: succinate--CoA ligase subunit beta, partial [Chloroflexi bacterium]|nr:succinate--CoA ligase subunit beta [Chloroflexota bacterium]
MKLQEHQSKRIFAQYGVPVPEGGVATTPQEAREIAERLGKPVVVKAQVLVGGRGKAGGVRLAGTPEEAGAIAAQILGMNVRGLPVRSVLVEEAADIASEIYLGVVVDRAAKRPVMMA